METALICFSGGHSSAIAAIEAVRKYGKNNVILLNHDIALLDKENGVAGEHHDIKRFKEDISNYLDVPITYANMPDCEKKDQLDICLEKSGFQFQAGQSVCTYNLKTLPFYKYLSDNFPASLDNPCKDIKIMYGFDRREVDRIQRRSSILGQKGYFTDYPLALWKNRTIDKTEEIGIARPKTYKLFKHANCVGCLKAGRQHWYIVYCLYPKIFEKAMESEEKIGHSIIKDIYLYELIPKFEEMKQRGICPNENENSASFWARVESTCPEQIGFLPCECAVL